MIGLKLPTHPRTFKMHRGYIALWRRIEDHPFYKEPREFSKYEAWLDILMSAQHCKKPKQVIIGMNVFICNYGECLKSIKTWSRRWNWSRSKVFRFLKMLEKMEQVVCKSEQKTTRIKIINYGVYDPKRNKRETQANTDNNVNNVKEHIDEIINHLNKSTGKKFKATSTATKKSIKARLNDGFTVEDFKHVIDVKVEDWLGDSEYEKYLCPGTLFRPSKFEKYLNQKPKPKAEWVA